ncbi:FliO/MopB family protein [Azohydromonas aeria]|uniref:FliO/MopB family protein n=1 Tax=Azohydromonas aeria TaxID=2590212 RepID=UPI0012F83EBF|nr:flagellar biosynthetic protein FliO [Azohydromonas aeria]
MEAFVSNFARMLAALALVLVLAWIALRLLRRRMDAKGALVKGLPAGSEALRFVRALPVGPKERVVIVEHRGERWMLGVAAGGISTLAHWPAQGAAAVAEPVSEARTIDEKALRGGASD